MAYYSNEGLDLDIGVLDEALKIAGRPVDTAPGQVTNIPKFGWWGSYAVVMEFLLRDEMRGRTFYKTTMGKQTTLMIETLEGRSLLSVEFKAQPSVRPSPQPLTNKDSTEVDYDLDVKAFTKYGDESKCIGEGRLSVTHNGRLVAKCVDINAYTSFDKANPYRLDATSLPAAEKDAALRDDLNRPGMQQVMGVLALGRQAILGV